MSIPLVLLKVLLIDYLPIVSTKLMRGLGGDSEGPMRFFSSLTHV